MIEMEPYNVKHVHQVSFEVLFKTIDHLMLTISVIEDTVERNRAQMSVVNSFGLESVSCII